MIQVPISEISNGLIKWYFRVPRPGWVDRSIELRAWSHEYSFPSSHAQIIFSLATFFVLTSQQRMRKRMYVVAGSRAGGSFS